MKLLKIILRTPIILSMLFAAFTMGIVWTFGRWLFSSESIENIWNDYIEMCDIPQLYREWFK